MVRLGKATSARRRLQVALWLYFVVGAAATTFASDAQPSPTTDQVVEIRSYTLKPGTRERFHDLFVAAALPLLIERQVDVVAFGPSLHDENSYFLIRAFDSLRHREQSEADFYGSPEWIDGPRQAILDCIDRYSTVVRPVDTATITSMRQLSAAD